MGDKNYFISAVITYNVFFVTTPLRTPFLVLDQGGFLVLLGHWVLGFTMRHLLWTRSSATLWCSLAMQVQRKKLTMAERVRDLLLPFES